MIDLFGEEITRPRTIPARGIENAAAGFADFWSAWPSGPRKVAKQQCLDKWATVGAAAHSGLILKHIAWLKTQPDWTKENGAFICAPLVYLNQQRWVDWEVIEVKGKPAVDPELSRIYADRRAAAPMPADVKARLQQLRRGG